MTPTLFRKIILAFIFTPIVSIAIYYIFFFGHLSIDTGGKTDYNVYINGNNRGEKTSLRLQKGKYDLKITKAGYYDLSDSIEISIWQTTSYKTNWRMIPKITMVKNYQDQEQKNYSFNGAVVYNNKKESVTSFSGLRINNLEENQKYLVANTDKGAYLIDLATKKKVKASKNNVFLLEDNIFDYDRIIDLADISKQIPLPARFSYAFSLSDNIIIALKDMEIHYIDGNDQKNNFQIDNFKYLCEIETCTSKVIEKIEKIDAKSFFIFLDNKIYRVVWRE